MNKGFYIVIFEWLATFLTVAASASVLLQLRLRSRVFCVSVLCVCALVPLVPYSGLNISQYFLTIVGHISVTSIMLLASVVTREIIGKTLWKCGERRWILAGVVIGSLFVLPATFGLIRYDGYQLGYASLPLILALLALAVAAALTRRTLAFLTMCAAAAAFQLHLLASNNLWDYLFDPLLTIAAFAILIRNAVRYVNLVRKSIGQSPESR